MNQHANPNGQGSPWQPTYDSFQDVRYDTAGIFDSATISGHPSLNTFDAVRAGVLSDGAAFEFTCTGCGKPKRLTLDYAELLALDEGFSPAEVFQLIPGLCTDPTSWRIVDGTWRLSMPCNTGAGSAYGGCRYHYPMELSAGEPAKLLAEARAKGLWKPGSSAVLLRAYVNIVGRALRVTPHAVKFAVAKAQELWARLRPSGSAEDGPADEDYEPYVPAPPPPAGARWAGTPVQAPPYSLKAMIAGLDVEDIRELRDACNEAIPDEDTDDE